jgi:hypothetical protein
MSRTWRSKLGYIFARGAFNALRDKMDPRKVNGGVFLGLNSVVVKSHGGTDAEGFASAVEGRLRHGPLRSPAQDQSNTQPRRPRSFDRAECAGGCLVTVMRSVVLGHGAYLPERVLTNAELAKMVDTSDEWIVQRTGIKERHRGRRRVHLSGLKAAQAALANAGIDAQSIDLIVLATSTPDNTRDGGGDPERTRHQPRRGIRSCRPCAPGSSSHWRPPTTFSRAALSSVRW